MAPWFPWRFRSSGRLSQGKRSAALCLALACCLPACRAPAPLAGGPGLAILPEAWRLYGSIVVHTSERALRARLRWHQQGEHYNLRLIGPLGSGSYEIDGDAAGLMLTDSKGRVRRAPGAQALMQEELGWSVPLEALRYWVRGRPAPGLPMLDPEWDARGRLRAWNQEGCRIRVYAYQDPTGPQAGPPLPSGLSVSNEQLRLELKLDTWQSL